MKVAPRPFRPHPGEFVRQARGCLSLGVILPTMLVVSVAVNLPWSSEVPEDWVAGLKTGLLVGIAVFGFVTIVLTLVRLLRQNLAESRRTKDGSLSTLQGAITGAEEARTSAINGAEWIDQAYALFAERSYNDFWDAVENSEAYLRRCCGSLSDIHARRLTYSELLTDREHTLPDIDSEVGVLLDPRPDMHRLAEIVREANREPTFATIFAQRKTTQAVESGFQQLTAAVQQLEKSVTASLEDLKSAVVTEIQKSRTVQTQILQGVKMIATQNARTQKAE